MPSAVPVVLISWFVLVLILVGLGQFIRGWFSLRLSNLDGWFAAFWIGYATTIAALQIWQLALPIDWRAGLTLSAFGLVGLVWGVIRLVRPYPPPTSPSLRSGEGDKGGEVHSPRFTRIRTLLFALLFLLALAPIVLWVTGRALDYLKDYDTGLYHLSSIRWLNEYPIVPGLGNLHYRLAFNQSFFLFVAALNIYPLTNLGFHFANSLLVIVLIAQSLRNILYLLLYPRRFTPYRLLSALFLPVLIYRISPQRYSANISSPSPDLTIFVVQAVVTLAFTRYLFESTTDANERKFSAFLAIALSVVCITTKLSGAVFGVAIIALLGIHWLLTHRDAIGLAFRQVATWILAASLLIGLPWMVRGVILSGYPAFPSTFGALPLDWRIPIETTREAADWIASFARQPRGDIATILGSWDWVHGWIGLMQEQFNIFLFVLPLYIFLGALAAALIVLIILRILRRRRALTLWLPFLPALLSAIFWFLGAPDPRFAGSAFWILAIWGLVFVFALFWHKPPILVTYAALLPPTGIAAYLIFVGLTTHVDLNRIRFPSVPVAPIRTYQTASGLVVNMSADQANHLLLWDMPLPTTPYELPGLELRGQDFRDGFRTRPTPE